MSGVILALLMEFHQVLLNYGCQQPRIFALKKEVVLSCEAGEWKRGDLVPRASVLLSSLAFTYPYGEKFSLVLRKFRIPVLQITVDREEVVKFLAGREEDFPDRWRVYPLEGRVFRFYGLAMGIIPGKMKPLPHKSGKIEVERYSCRAGKLLIEASYSLVDKARLMLIMEEEGRKITRIFTLKGSGKAQWNMEVSRNEIKCKLYTWEGNWRKIWEAKINCEKEEK